MDVDLTTKFHWKGMLFAFCIVAFVGVVFMIPWVVGLAHIIKLLFGG